MWEGFHMYGVYKALRQKY